MKSTVRLKAKKTRAFVVERGGRILFRQADLTEERLETWNRAERVGHGIHV